MTLYQVEPEGLDLRRPPVDQWPLYVYRIADAEAAAQHLDRRFGGRHRGFWYAWAGTKLTWNGERAGLLRLPQRSLSMASTLRYYRRLLGFELTPYSDLGDADSLVDDFGTLQVSLLPRGQGEAE